MEALIRIALLDMEASIASYMEILMAAALDRSRSEEQERAAVVQFAVSELAQGLQRLADGDLGASINAQVAPQYQGVKDNFNGAVQKLLLAISAVSSSVQAMRVSTDEMSQASDDMARRTEQQAASLEETAAALNEITKAVHTTAQSAKQAADVTDLARKGAVKSGEVVRQAIHAMGQIEQSSDKIAKIIGVIDEIAFQTNLLALNAGVEAARAGEAGRGFAVVAQEVRGLAQRSAEAAKEIKELISASTHQVGQGVDLVGQTGLALDKMGEQVAELTALVTAIAESANEQATSLNEVNAAVNQMDQVTQQNAAMVEQSTAASKELAGEADELMHLMAQFKTGEAPSAPRRSTTAQRPAPVPAAVRRSGPAGRPAAARKLEIVATADEWAEF